MSIKILRNVAGHTKDDVIETTPKAAALLIEQGYAEEVKESTPKGKTTKTDTKTPGGDSPSK